MEGRILFGISSREAGLETYLSRNYPFPLEWKSNIFIKPEGKIREIFSLLKNKFVSLPRNQMENSKIVFAGGLWNLTSKVRHAEGEELCYIRSDANIQCIIAEYGSVCEYFSSQHIPIYFATIPPVSILKIRNFNISKSVLYFSQYSLSDIASMQSSLEKDIMHINEYLKSLNERQNISNIRLDRSVSKYGTRKRGKHGQRSSKRFCFTYKELYDGVHPTDELATKWFTYMCSSVHSDIMKLKDN